jgi:hypothetical protein
MDDTFADPMKERIELLLDREAKEVPRSIASSFELTCEIQALKQVA